MEEFKIGDVVKLKSGGQMMVVIANKIGGWFCSWHDIDGIPRDGIYPSDSLVIVEEF